jgi:hypothetical protein
MRAPSQSMCQTFKPNHKPFYFNTLNQTPSKTHHLEPTNLRHYVTPARDNLSHRVDSSHTPGNNNKSGIFIASRITLALESARDSPPHLDNAVRTRFGRNDNPRLAIKV